MQVMIKSTGNDGTIYEKGPVILNRATISFVERVNAIAKNDARLSPETPYEVKALHDDMVEQGLWMIQCSTGVLLVDTPTALLVEKWLGA